MQKIVEIGSDLEFIIADDKNFFHIEKSKIYKNLSNSAISTVEFLIHKTDSNVLFFIEAKRNFIEPDDNSIFSKKIDDIKKKFIDSFQLACSIWFERHGTDNKIPSNYREFFTKGTKFYFVLIVKNLPDKALMYLNKSIINGLNRERMIWGIDVIVMNEKKARDRKFIV
jgi:hypothetical protein